jgi:hypothetical protein
METMDRMRCFYVFVHGKLTWDADRSGLNPGETPAGFYCHRYVLAQTEADAREKAFRRVRDNLDAQTNWLRDGLVRLRMRAEELSVAPMHKLLMPENRGHTFYTGD